ncbi:hypothetical protein DEJ36_04475 [Curtobacterium sp. MCPF17_052]|nr:hypothetical protein [Curtobacterium sp. MCPF17_052]WIB13165.1 hypothetical protein DEJ36_04475 [Curtobacterium sp. MCPF17_052]
MSRPDGVLTGSVAAGRRRVVDTVVSMPAWAAVLLLWAVGRLLSTMWLMVAYPLMSRVQPDNALWGNDHGFTAFLTSWDGQYYEAISLHGYPSVLPLDATGHVAQNAWAFLPAFPFTIRLLTVSTGLPFTIGGPAVAIIAGLIATFLLHRLVQDHAGDTAALWAVFFFTCGPLSFLLQVGYAETAFLALTFGALLAMERRRYGLLTVLGIVASFTRPGALAIPPDPRRHRARPVRRGPSLRRPQPRRVPRPRAGPGRGRRTRDGRRRSRVAGHRRLGHRSPRCVPGDRDVLVGELHRPGALRPAVAVVPDHREVARCGRCAHGRRAARALPGVVGAPVDSEARDDHARVRRRVRALRVRRVAADGVDPAAAHAARAADGLAGTRRETGDALDPRRRGAGPATGVRRGALAARAALTVPGAPARAPARAAAARADPHG